MTSSFRTSESCRTGLRRSSIFCFLLPIAAVLLLAACQEKRQTEASGISDDGESALTKIKDGMSLSEVETLLGKSVETQRPDGKSLPFGAWTNKNDKLVFVAGIYRRWQIGNKSVIISFLDDHVVNRSDGSVALVEPLREDRKSGAPIPLSPQTSQ